MPPPGLAITPHELSFGAIEVDDLGSYAGDRMNEAVQPLGLEAAASNIHPDRDVGRPALGSGVDERLQQVCRKVVDHIPAQVFEGIEHGRFPGT